MTWNVFFVGLIAAIGLLHLATTAVRFVSGRRDSLSPEETRMARTGERGDWYVFFHCADLLGRAANNEAPGNAVRDRAEGAPARQEKARRSRARISL